MIVLENVVKEYPNGVGAINGISLHIERGEFVFVVGDSGSGKSTLIKLLLKELEPTSGTIRVNGVNLGRMKKRAIPKYRRKIGCVFQDFRLLKDRNVYENVAFAQRSRKMFRPCCRWWDWQKNTSHFQDSSPVENSREWHWRVRW